MIRRIRTLIVDDEPLARDSVRILLATQPDVEVVGTYGDASRALTALVKQQVDLMFLDIQMPELDGFELIQALPASRIPATVFITAYDEFAIQAFEMNAVDYLLKPYDNDRFYRALDRARARLRQEAPHENPVGNLVRHLSEAGYRRRMAVKTGRKIVLIDVSDLDWLRGAGGYTEIQCASQKYLVDDTLKDLEALLDPKDFMRIHRSVIINVHRIKELEPHINGEYIVICKDGARFKLSRGYKDQAQRLINGM